MEPNESDNIKNRPHKHPFTVPESYFDNLPMQIQQRLQTRQKQSIIFRPFLELGQLRLRAVMAIILVLAAGVWFSLQQQQTEYNQPRFSIAQLSEQEIYHYLESDDLYLETSDLAMLTTMEDPGVFSLPSGSEKYLEEELDYSEIEDYYL